jgi:5,10-methenyltetrahydrofolate synthetase
MTNPELWQQYRSLLDKANFIIIYAALSDEIDINKVPHFEIVKDKPTFVVPPTHKIEPKEVAKVIINTVAAACALKPVPCTLIFLPGQKFDLTGTRKGRGYGWYDRLLAELPNNWIRIGVATASQIESTPLIRNPWDQPIDWLIWRDETDRWNMTKTKNPERP